MLNLDDKKRLLRFQKAQIIFYLDDKEFPDGAIGREQLDALEGLKSITDPQVARLVKVATQEVFLDELTLEDMKVRFAEIQKALQELVKISIGVKDIRPDFLKQLQ